MGQDRYQLLDRLGQGGMGEVYRARALGPAGFEKIVAVKRLRREVASDADLAARLMGEAQLLVSLQHSNLVSILDLVRTEEDAFLVLEYVDGPDVATLLEAGRARGQVALPEDAAAQIVLAACDGVAHAHQRPLGPVIHADLSPHNLLVSRSGEVKVTDFGIARREGARTSGIEGNWPYMSPEQARGEPLTTRSDVFSLGAVLYELLTGKLPFPGEGPEEVRQALLRCSPLPPRQIAEGLSPSLEALCLRALQADTAARFAGAREMASALREEALARGWAQEPGRLSQLVRERLEARSEAAREALLELGIGGAGTSPAPLRRGTELQRAPASVTGWQLRGPRRTRALALGALGTFAALALLALVLRQRPAATSNATPTANSNATANATSTATPTATPTANATSTPTPTSTPNANATLTPTPNAASTPNATPATNPTVAASVEKQKPPHRRRARPARAVVAAHPLPNEPHAPRRPPAEGTLRLYSEPWAEVRVDGKDTGLTTPVSALKLAAGPHRVSLRNPVLGISRELDVSVQAGEVRLLQVTLDEQPAPQRKGSGGP